MCPDKETISAFCDNELDEEWSSRLSLHIQSCNDCAAYYKKISAYSKQLQSIELPKEEEIKKQIYASIKRKMQFNYSKGLWQKRLDFPFPVFAGAVMLIFLLFAIISIGYLNRSKAVMEISEIKEIPSEPAVKLIKMEDAAAFILGNDEGFDILITIPIEEKFSLEGRPEFIREADYKRSR